MLIVGIFVVIAIFCGGAKAGPQTGHSHGHTHVAHKTPAGSKEAWRITVHRYSGREDGTTWVVSDWGKNLENVMKALNIYTHSPASKTDLASLLGYQGFNITHIVDGKDMDFGIIPACKMPALESALIRMTYPVELDQTAKNQIYCIINNCGKANDVKEDCWKISSQPKV